MDRIFTIMLKNYPNPLTERLRTVNMIERFLNRKVEWWNDEDIDAYTWISAINIKFMVTEEEYCLLRLRYC